MTTEEFIEKAKEIHKNKYDYSKVEYVNTTTPVTIICPIHGEFQQRPTDHLKGYGCKRCAAIKANESRKLTTEEFIRRARKVHGDKYDYSKTNYVNNNTKVTIICPIHGEFYQLPYNHLRGKGCRKCNSLTIDENGATSNHGICTLNFVDLSQFKDIRVEI